MITLMKLKRIFFLLFIVAFVSCKKSGNSVSVKGFKKLTVPSIIIDYSSGLSTTQLTSISVGNAVKNIGKDYTFKIINNGSGDAFNIRSTISGSSSSFSFKGGSYPGTGGTCASSLLKESNCTIVVNFKPIALSHDTETFTVNFEGHADGVKNYSAKVSIDGSGKNGGKLVNQSYDFTSVLVNSSKQHFFTVTNSGDMDVTNMNISRTFVDSHYTFTGGAYPGTSGTCSSSLSPSGSCTLEVQFLPTAVSTLTDFLTLDYFDGGLSKNVQLDVTGRGASLAKLDITPITPYDFVGAALSTNLDKLVTITNNGTFDATSITVSGITGKFSLLSGFDNCTATILAAGANCTFKVRFNSTTAGNFTSPVNVSYIANGGATPVNADPYQLKASVIANTTLIFNPVVSGNFGAKKTGGAASQIVFSVNNPGAIAAENLITTVTGTYFSKVATTCQSAGQLTPASTCTVTVQYAPTAQGVHAGTLSINYLTSPGGSAVSTPLQVNLNGSAKDVGAISFTDMTDGTFNFGDVINGVVSTTRDIKITNTATLGGSNVAFSSITGFAASKMTAGSHTCSNTQVLTPTQTCLIRVNYTSTGEGAVNNLNLQIAYNDGFAVATPATQLISANGVQRAKLEYFLSSNLATAITTHDFLNVIQGLTKSVSITLKNTGGTPATLLGEGAPALAGDIDFSNAGAYPGLASGGCGLASLPPNGTCLLDFTFSPSSSSPTGLKTLKLKYSDGLGALPNASMTFQGTGKSKANLVANFSPFSSQEINVLSVENEIQITNTGASSAQSLNPSFVTGTQFLYGNGTFPGRASALPSKPLCSTVTDLLPGASCYIYFKFKPTTAGTKTDTFNISYFNGVDTGAPSPLAISLSANGFNPATLVYKQATVIKTAQSFNDAAVAGTPQVVTFKLENTSTVSQVVFTVPAQLAGQYRFSNSVGTTQTFTASGNCPANGILAATSFCTFYVKYTPSTAGATDTGSLSLVHTVGGSAAPNSAISFTGRTFNKAALSIVADTDSAYGNITVGNTSIVKYFTITNVANSFSAVNLSASTLPIGFRWAGGGAFPGTGGNCGTTLLKGANCKIAIDFMPASASVLGGSINLSYDDGISTGVSLAPTITLSGTGISKALLAITSDIAAGGGPFNFGTFLQTTTSPAHTFTITNSGQTATTSTAITGLLSDTAGKKFKYVGGVFPGTGGSCTLPIAANGGTCILKLDYLASTVGGVGADNTVLTVNYNNGVGPATAVTSTLQGNAYAGSSLLANAPTVKSLVLPATTLGNTSQRIFEFKHNTGVENIIITSITYPAHYSEGTTTQAGTKCSTLPTLSSTQNCYIDVKFTPGATTGAINENIVVHYKFGAGNTTGASTLALQGSGVSKALLVINGGADITFSNVSKGTSAGSNNSKIVWVENTGGSSADLTGKVKEVTAVGGAFTPFSFKGGAFPGTGGSCTSTILPGVGNKCSVMLAFSSATAGTSTSTEKINLNYNDGSLVLPTAAAQFINGVVKNGANLVLKGTPSTTWADQFTSVVTTKQFTLENLGDMPANLSTVILTDANTPAKFTKVADLCAGTSIAAKAGATISSCTFDIQYTSTTAAVSETSSLVATYSNDSIITTVPVTFTATSKVKGELLFTSLNPFGDRAWNAVAGTRADLNVGIHVQTITVTATAGKLPVTITSESLLGANFIYKSATPGVAGTFPGLGGNCVLNSAISAGSPCDIVVEFVPSAVGMPLTTSLTLNYNDGSAVPNQVVGSLSGNAPASADLAYSAGTVNFGSSTINVATTQDITIINNGGVSATNIVLSLSNTFYTKIAGGNCGTTLGAGATCIQRIQFLPTSTGVQNTNLTANYNDGTVDAVATPHLVSGDIISSTITGNALSLAKLEYQLLASTITNHDFGTVAKNSNATQNIKIIQVKNTGGSSASAITGTIPAGYFNFSGSSFPGTVASTPCSTSIAAGAVCNIELTYLPTAASVSPPDTKNLTIAYQDGDGGAAVNSLLTLTGTAKNGASLAVSTTPTFADQAASITSPVKTFIFTNSGDMAATSPVITGFTASKFTNTATGAPACTSTIAAGGGTCQINVTYSNTVSSTDTLNLNIAYNSGSIAQNASVSVNAKTVGNGVLNLAASTNFGSRGWKSAGVLTPKVAANTQIITLTAQAGNLPIKLTSEAIANANFNYTGAAFPGTNGTCALNSNYIGGATCDLEIEFTPSANGNPVTSNLTFNYFNGASTISKIVSLTGVSPIVSSLAVSPVTAKDFGLVANTTTNTFSYTVTKDAGSTAATAIAISALSPLDSEYTLVNNCSTLTTAGSTCTIDITYAPSTTTGTNNARGFTLSYNDGVESVPLSLSLSGSSAPAALLTGTTPSGASFNPTTEGNLSTNSLTVHFANVSGNVPGVVSSVNFPATELNKLSDNCTVSASITNVGCDVVFQYHPANPGTDTFAISLTYASGVGTVTTPAVNLTGPGLSKAALVFQVAASTPANTAEQFGGQATGSTTSPAHIYIFKNTGATQATNVAVPALSLPFVLDGTGTCSSLTGGNLPAGNSCTVKVVYTPTSGTAVSDNTPLIVNYKTGVTSGSLTSTTALTLTGNEITPAVLSFDNTGATGAFGTVINGTTSPVRLIKIQNTGTFDATVASYNLPAQYARNGGTCPASTANSGTGVIPTGSCTIGIQLASISNTASYTGNLTVTYNDGAVTQSNKVITALSGIGGKPADLVFTGNITTFDFGSVAVNSTSGTNNIKTISVTNIGDVAATTVSLGSFAATSPAVGNYLRFGISGAGYPGNGIPRCGVTIAPATPCLIEITYLPNVVQIDNANFRLKYDDGASIGVFSTTVKLTGTAKAGASLAFSATPTYTDQATNEIQKHVFKITNSGDMSATNIAIAGITSPFTATGAGVVDPACALSSGVIGVGATCELELQYSSVSAGTHSNTLAVTYLNDSISSSIANQIVTANTIGAGVLSATSPGNLGIRVVGSPNDPAKYRGQITLAAASSKLSVNITKLNFDADFALDGAWPGAGGSCLGVIPSAGTPNVMTAGSSCTIGVVFNPQTSGVKGGTSNFSIDYFGGTNSGSGIGNASAALQGTGLDKSVLTFTPVDNPWGQVVETSTGSYFVTVTNPAGTNTSSVTILAPTPTTISNTTFSFAGGFPGTTLPGDNPCNANMILSPGNSCKVKVSYTAPTAIHPTNVVQNGTYTFNYNDGVSGVTQALTFSLTSGSKAAFTSTPTPTNNTFATGVTVGNVGTEVKTITFQNTGDHAATNLTTTIPTEFATGITDNCNGVATLAKNATCTVLIKFKALAQGVFNGNVTLNFDNGIATGDSFSQAMVATGKSAPNIVFAIAGDHDFGSVVQGSTINQTLTIKNTGDTTATNITLGSATAGSGFTWDVASCTSLVTYTGSETCTVNIHYASSNTSALFDNLVVSWDYPGSSSLSVTKKLLATPQKVGVLNSTVFTANFGDVIINPTTRPTLSISIFNAATTGSANVSAITLPTIPTGFSVTSNSCTTALVPQIDGGSTCVITFDFNPTSAISYGGVVGNISYNNGAATISTPSLTLSGTGGSPAILSINGGINFTFAPNPAGNGGTYPGVFFVKNTGGVNAIITSSPLGATTNFNYANGSFPGSTTDPGRCTSTTIVPTGGGTGCKIFLKYLPTVASGSTSVNTSFTLNYNDGTAVAATKTITVTGVSKNPALLAPSVSTHDFTQQVQGSTTEFIVTVTNGAPTLIDAQSITATISGTDAAQYALNTVPADHCGAGGVTSLATGISCKVYVQYKPTTTGTHNAAQIDVAYKDFNDGIHTTTMTAVTLNGNSIVPPQIKILASFSTSAAVITSFNFNNVSVGTDSAIKTLTLYNPSTLPVTSLSSTITSTGGHFVYGNNSAFPGGTDAGNECGATLAGGAICKVFVKMHPNSIVNATTGHTLNITYNNGQASVSMSPIFNLLGNGLAPDHFVITGTGTIDTGACTTYTITSKDLNGVAANPATNLAINLTSSGAKSIFYNAGCTLAQTTATLPSTTSSVNVYMKDFLAESSTLTATSGSFTGSLPVTVIPETTTTPQLITIFNGQTHVPGVTSIAAAVTGAPTIVDGTSINVTIKAVDQYFNVHPADSTSVTLTSTEPDRSAISLGSFLGTTGTTLPSATALSSGVFATSVTFNSAGLSGSAGIWHLNANGGGYSSVNSSDATIACKAPASLQVVSPTGSTTALASATAGSAFNVKVLALKSTGKIETCYVNGNHNMDWAASTFSTAPGCSTPTGSVLTPDFPGALSGATTGNLSFTNGISVNAPIIAKTKEGSKVASVQEVTKAYTQVTYGVTSIVPSADVNSCAQLQDKANNIGTDLTGTTIAMTLDGAGAVTERQNIYLAAFDTYGNFTANRATDWTGDNSVVYPWKDIAADHTTLVGVKISAVAKTLTSVLTGKTLSVTVALGTAANRAISSTTLDNSSNNLIKANTINATYYYTPSASAITANALTGLGNVVGSSDNTRSGANQLPKHLFIVGSNSGLDMIDATSNQSFMTFGIAANNIFDAAAGTIYDIGEANDKIYVAMTNAVIILDIKNNAAYKIVNGANPSKYNKTISARAGGAWAAAGGAGTAQLSSATVYHLDAKKIAASSFAVVGTGLNATFINDNNNGTFTSFASTDGGVVKGVAISSNSKIYYSAETVGIHRFDGIPTANFVATRTYVNKLPTAVSSTSKDGIELGNYVFNDLKIADASNHLLTGTNTIFAAMPTGVAVIHEDDGVLGSSEGVLLSDKGIGSFPPGPAAGVESGSVYLDGTGYITSTVTTGFLDIFTSDFYFKPATNINSASGTIFLMAVGGSLAAQHTLGLCFNCQGNLTGSLVFYINGKARNEPAQVLLTSTNVTWNKGQWYHVAIELDNGAGGSDLNLWVDGVNSSIAYDNSRPDFDANGAGNNTITFGTLDAATTTNRFNGWIDEFRVCDDLDYGLGAAIITLPTRQFDNDVVQLPNGSNNQNCDGAGAGAGGDDLNIFHFDHVAGKTGTFDVNDKDNDTVSLSATGAWFTRSLIPGKSSNITSVAAQVTAGVSTMILGINESATAGRISTINNANNSTGGTIVDSGLVATYGAPVQSVGVYQADTVLDFDIFAGLNNVTTGGFVLRRK